MTDKTVISIFKSLGLLLAMTNESPENIRKYLKKCPVYDLNEEEFKKVDAMTDSLPERGIKNITAWAIASYINVMFVQQIEERDIQSALMMVHYNIIKYIHLQNVKEGLIEE